MSLLGLLRGTLKVNFACRTSNTSCKTIYLRKMSSDGVKLLNVSGNRQIAYHLYDGKLTEPTVVFVCGFMSTMEGFKAKALQKFCEENDRGYIRFDYEGMGKSPGNLKKALIGEWIEDLKCVVENLVPGKALLVGSSMGAWFSLRIAPEIPDKIHSLLMVAPAINFFQYYYNLFYKMMTPEQKALADAGEIVTMKKNFGEVFLSKGMTEESLKHHLDLTNPIAVNVPIRILHGVLDADVPYKQSLQIMQAVTSTDVDVTYRKNGKHQMSEEADLKLLIDTITTMLPPNKSNL